MEKLVMNRNVVVTSFSNYLDAGIPEVGKIIAKHTVFKAVVYGLTKGASRREHDVSLKLWKEKCVTSLNEYLKEKGIICRPGSVREYVSPFSEPSFSEEYGCHVVEADFNKVLEWAKASVECSLTDENIRRAAEDSDYAARLFSETAIDAVKKFTAVDCGYINGMGSPLASRRQGESAYSISIDWKGQKEGTGKMIASEDGGVIREKSGRITKTILHENFPLKQSSKYFIDPLEELRQDELSDIEGAYTPLINSEVNLPPECFRYNREISLSPKGRKLLPFFTSIKNIFHTADSSRRMELQYMRKQINSFQGYDYSEKSELIREAKEEINNRYRYVYSGIANMARVAGRELSPSERAAVMMSVVYSDDESEVNSDILSRLLPEEYIHYVAETAPKSNMACCDYVEAEVINKGFEPYEEVVFEFGVAVKGEKKAYSATEDLEGKWLMAEDGRHVRRPLAEFISVPEGDESSICFISKEMDREKAKEAARLVESGAEIYLALEEAGYNFFVGGIPFGRYDNREIVLREFYRRNNFGRGAHAVVSSYGRKARLAVIVKDCCHKDLNEISHNIRRKEMPAERKEYRMNGSLLKLAEKAADF